ncbi:MAG: DUF3078 domain-containing protein, partial [Bacteroidales bacterium]|nr:DUF3078 domain-containing protein [Bacteroidales bacterium]
MKRIVFIFSFLMIGTLAFAQITEAEDDLRSVNADTSKGWTTGGMVNINLAQSSFSNWAAGGQNSLGVNGLITAFANYRVGSSTWDNMLDVGYGVLQQGKGTGFIKTDDKIDFSSKFGRKASKEWYYAAMLNFKTQMTKGYNYPDDVNVISRLFAPAYLIGAVGMDYKPSPVLTAFISPFTAKTTFVLDDDLANAGAFGVIPAEFDELGVMVVPGQKVRSELGGYVRIVFNKTFFKDKSVSLLSKLDLFSNYLHKPQNIDVNWENIISFKINKYISATITTQLIYDDDI